MSKESGDIKKKLGTKEVITWCPGCPNHMILESTKIAISNLVSSGKFKHEDFAMTTDIGCSSKIFDYINISGVYGLHGRAIPTAQGIKLGNPNLKVLAFAGDGGVYSEGISHFMHSFRYNSDFTLVLHDNQAFSLTTGQPTATSELGYKSKSEPMGTFDKPFNPVKIALAAGATFVARANARDLKHTAEILEKAILHKGFSFVEIIQDCLIFNLEANNKDKMMYKIKDNKDIKKARELADEFDYNLGVEKIPLGVIYKSDEPSLEEKWPQLKKLVDKKTSWKGK